MGRTQILHVLVGEQAHDTGASLLGPHAGPQGLVDDNAVRDGGRDEGCAIRHLGGAGVVVHADPREGVPNDADEEGKVPGERVKSETVSATLSVERTSLGREGSIPSKPANCSKRTRSAKENEAGKSGSGRGQADQGDKSEAGQRWSATTYTARSWPRPSAALGAAGWLAEAEPL